MRADAPRRLLSSGRQLASYVAPDVVMICAGQRRRPPLLAAGAPGKRYVLPARGFIRQPTAGLKASPPTSSCRSPRSSRCAAVIDILVTATGQTVERVTADINRDYIVWGAAAVTYGSVDHVIERRHHPDATGSIAA